MGRLSSNQGNQVNTITITITRDHHDLIVKALDFYNEALKTRLTDKSWTANAEGQKIIAKTVFVGRVQFVHPAHGSSSLVTGRQFFSGWNTFGCIGRRNLRTGQSAGRGNSMIPLRMTAGQKRAASSGTPVSSG